MNDHPRLKSALESIAQRDISTGTDLWPRIEARLIRKETRRGNPTWKYAWIVFLVLLGLILTTTAAYALYHYFTDPGLKSADEAGLISEPDMTAQPTMLPTATPGGPAIQIGDKQIWDGVTVVLDWIYLNDSQQAFGFSVIGLPPEKKLGIPHMDFGSLSPEQYRGAGLAWHNGVEGITGTYVVYQIVRDEPVFDNHAEAHADVGIDIPVMDTEGQAWKTFHFDIPKMPIYLEPGSGGNIYATRSNSVEMHLEWIILAPQETQARLCLESLNGQTWDINTATIQLANTGEAIPDVAPVGSQRIAPVRGENGARCADITFPVSGQGAGFLYLAVNPLADSSGQTLDGNWIFEWAQLPGNVQIPGMVTPTPAAPVATQVVGNIKATLLQAYADANRFAFAVHIDGLPEGDGLLNPILKDANGKEINSGISEIPSDTEPGTFSLIFSPASTIQDSRFIGQLSFGVGKQDLIAGGNATAVFNFDLDLDVFPALILKPQQVSTAHGIEMRLEMAKITPSYTRLYVCYQKPDQNDWMIGRSSQLQIGEDQSSVDSYALAFDSAFDDAVNKGDVIETDWIPPNTSGRCVVLGFTVGHHNRPETLMLTIGELEQSAPEGIPDDQIQKARQQLHREGIDMDWVVSSGNGGGGAEPVISRKPEGMTDEDVMRRFYEALGYYFPGPWKFLVPFNP